MAKFNGLTITTGSNAERTDGGLTVQNVVNFFSNLYMGSKNSAINFCGSGNSAIGTIFLDNGNYLHIGSGASTETINTRIYGDSVNIYYRTTGGTTSVRLACGQNSCTFYTALYGVAFFESSDERLKNFEDDVIIDFEKLSKLKKKYFRWKKDKTKKNIGVSAQEIQEIYPEIVSEGDNGFLNVDYAKLSVIALAAIDKQQEEIKKQEEELKQQRKEIDELRGELDIIKHKIGL